MTRRKTWRPKGGVALWCVFFLDLAVAQVKAVPPEWTRQLGTAAVEVGYGVSADGLGNVYITGYTAGSLDGPNAGDNDAFLSKYNASGNLQWTRQLGTAIADYSYEVSADGLGNVYISGSLGGTIAGTSDAFLSKYDAAGSLQWTRQIENSENSKGVCADTLGNVYISGNTVNDLGGPHAGMGDVFVRKYDSAGDPIWTRQLGTSASDENYGISVDGLGNVYITGQTDGELGSIHAGSADAFLTKYSAAGTLLWTQQLGTVGADYGTGVSADILGNVFISGYTNGELVATFGAEDAFVAMYDAAGSLQWTRQLGTFAEDHGLAASVDGLGNVYISGYTAGNLGGPNAGATDAFISKFDAAGNLQWTQQLGTSAHDQSNGVSVDGLGNVYISGETDGSLGGPNSGGRDAFVAKFRDSPGDYDFNGIVDVADYVLWRSNVGNTVPRCTGGDANCNSFVENEEYQPWRENYGRTYGLNPGAAGSAYGDAARSIPEPSALLLVGLATLGMIGLGAHRRRASAG